MLEQWADELQGEEAYQAWMSSLTNSLWREEMREEGMRINAHSSSAFIQILLAAYIVHMYRNYAMTIV